MAWLGSRLVLAPGSAAAPALDEVRRVVPPDQRVVIEVLNGSGVQGAARIATRVLRRAGFDVIAFDNAPEQVDSTVVLVRRGAPERGEWLVKALGTGRLSVEEAPARRVDLTVILGPDWRRPQGVLP